MKLYESQVRRKIRELIFEQFDGGKTYPAEIRAGRPDPKMKRAKESGPIPGGTGKTIVDPDKIHTAMQDFIESSKNKISC